MARILVVEDNEDNLHLMEIVLGAQGHEILLARNGEEGVRVALAERPDLILMDLSMPGTPNIVAVTASAMVGDRERVLSAGFDGFLTKPISVERFGAQIAEFLP